MWLKLTHAESGRKVRVNMNLIITYIPSGENPNQTVLECVGFNIEVTESCNEIDEMIVHFNSGGSGWRT